MEGSGLTFVLNKLDSLLRDELQHLGKVRDDFVYIRDELMRMTAFLGVADAVEQSEPQIKVWVEQVREVSYDAEDVIDEFVHHFTHQHRHGISGKIHKSFRSIKTLNSRHKIGLKIQGIILRVRSISEGYTRLNGMNLLEKGSSSTAAPDASPDYREDALLLEEDEVVGIDEPREQLVRWLVEGDSILSVISVVGMGGLGKTTLVKKVYDDTRVSDHFQNYAWITVSESFKINDLLKDLIQQLYETKQPVPEGLEKMKRHTLRTIIKKFLRLSTYVLVFDDVWSIDAWDYIKTALPKGGGGRVILTTRNEEIASISAGEFNGHVYRMKFLTHEESLTLFCRKTFQQDSCPDRLEDVSLSILEKCEGLPLAIVAISGVLATKDKDRIDEWEMIRRSLGAEIQANSKLEKKIKKVLSLSFNDLPYHLKACFLYLSIFPEDHLIEEVRLIRLWIAEGFVKARQGSTSEEVAKGYLIELLNRNLIRVEETTVDGKVKSCRIHDLLREMIILKSRDQNFATIAKEEDMMWPEKVRRLSVVNTLKNVQENLIVSQLRSFHMFEVEDSLSKSFLRTLFPGSFKMLKVLDLRGADLEIFPEGVVQLFHLRYLSLRDTKVKKIPGSIKKLKNLETLDLKHAYVTKLPVEILKLQRLRHLMVYRYESESYTNFHSKFGFEALAKIGCLQSLQKLGHIEANRGSPFIATELGRLTQLRRLSILKLRYEDGNSLCSAIAKMSCLRSLSVTSKEENEVIDLKCLSPPKFLQRLYLKGPLKELPHWIPSLDSLVKLYLKWSQLAEDPLEHLQKLHNLVHLELHKAYSGVELRFKAGGFGKLKILGLVQFDQLRHVEMENGALPCLEKLIIQHCQQLQKVPSGVERLTKLKVLECFDMPEDFIKRLRPREQGEDFLKVAHIPEVYSSKRIGSDWDSETLSERKSSSLSSTVLRSHELRYCWK